MSLDGLSEGIANKDVNEKVIQKGLLNRFLEMLLNKIISKEQFLTIMKKSGVKLKLAQRILEI